MSLKLFPTFERITFNEDAKENYEQYTAVVLDKKHNLFKVVTGPYRDKKDMYEKLSKQGLILRKAYEADVWDWIEDNADTALEGYLMYSTAVSKWRNNNMLADKYVKILNEIPKLNRERQKGNPNTRGQAQKGWGESIMEEEEMDNEPKEVKPEVSDWDELSTDVETLPDHLRKRWTEEDIDWGAGESSEHTVRIYPLIGENDENGKYVRDENGKIITKRDPNFEKSKSLELKKVKLFDKYLTDKNRVLDNPRIYEMIYTITRGVYSPLTDEGEYANPYGDSNRAIRNKEALLRNFLRRDLLSKPEIKSEYDAIKSEEDRKAYIDNQIQQYLAVPENKENLAAEFKKYLAHVADDRFVRATAAAKTPLGFEVVIDPESTDSKTVRLNSNAALDLIRDRLLGAAYKWEPSGQHVQHIKAKLNRLLNLRAKADLMQINTKLRLEKDPEQIEALKAEQERLKNLINTHYKFPEDDKFKADIKAAEEEGDYAKAEMVKKQRKKFLNAIFGNDLNTRAALDKEIDRYRVLKVDAEAGDNPQHYLKGEAKALFNQYNELLRKNRDDYYKNHTIDAATYYKNRIELNAKINDLTRGSSEEPYETDAIEKLKTLNKNIAFLNKKVSADPENVKAKKELASKHSLKQAVANTITTDLQAALDYNEERAVAATNPIKGGDSEGAYLSGIMQRMRNREKLERLLNAQKSGTSLYGKKGGTLSIKKKPAKKDDEVKDKDNVKKLSNEIKNLTKKLISTPENSKDYRDISNRLDNAKAELERASVKNTEVEEAFVNDGVTAALSMVPRTDFIKNLGAAIPLNGTIIKEDNLSETQYTKDFLNQDLFDDETLRDDVRKAFIEIADTFEDSLNIDVKPVDIYFTGSSANYNYNDQSDIDLHLVYDFEDAGINAEILKLYFNAAKQNFNRNYDIKVKGLPVEVGCENVAEPLITTAIYSIKDNKWIKKPTLIGRKTADPDMILFHDITASIEKAIESKNPEVIEKVWKYLGGLRKESLAKEGEFGAGNALFKKLRNFGYLGRLKDAFYANKSEELSLESLEEIE